MISASSNVVTAVAGSKGRILRTARPGYPASKFAVVPRITVNGVLAHWRSVKVTTIFCLLSDAEQLFYYGTLLTTIYKRGGFAVYSFPIQDHSIPRMELAQTIAETAREVITKDKTSRILIHCSAGIGRTGMAVSFIAAYMRKHGPFKRMAFSCTQTEEQADCILDFIGHVEGRDGAHHTKARRLINASGVSNNGFSWFGVEGWGKGGI